MITKETTIREILETDESLAAILVARGLQCQGCPGAANETLSEAAKGHQTDLEALLAELNRRSAP